MVEVDGATVVVVDGACGMALVVVVAGAVVVEVVDGAVLEEVAVELSTTGAVVTSTALAPAETRTS